MCYAYLHINYTIESLLCQIKPERLQTFSKMEVPNKLEERDDDDDSIITYPSHPDYQQSEPIKIEKMVHTEAWVSCMLYRTII